MYCLDTDIVIAFLRGYSDARNKIINLRTAGTDIAITPITLCELYRGACLSKDKEKNVTLINGFTERVSLLNQNKVSCQFFGEDYAYLKKKGLMTQTTDLMIASICKAQNCVLVTRNIQDFKNISNLLMEKW